MRGVLQPASLDASPTGRLPFFVNFRMTQSRLHIGAGTVNGAVRRTSPPAAGATVRTVSFINEFILVEGVNFMCFAYRDHDGQWHKVFESAELPGVIRAFD